MYYCDGLITNCTITANVAYEGNGGGLAGCGGKITNCIIWNNNAGDSGDQLYSSSAPTYICIMNWTGGGTGNINTDPLLVSGPKGDYYLSQTVAGQGATSSCVDAGSDTAANLGMDALTTRTDEVHDQGIVDMGYHFPAEMIPELNVADFNKDDKVN